MTRGIKPQVTFSPVGVPLRAIHLRAITRNVRLATVWAAEPSRREIDACRQPDEGTVRNRAARSVSGFALHRACRAASRFRVAMAFLMGHFHKARLCRHSIWLNRADGCFRPQA